MLERLRGSFHLAVLVLCGALAVVAIVPFAVLRLVQGQYWIGAVDLLVVAVIAGAASYAWRSGRLAGPGRLVTGMIAIALVAIGDRLGLNAVLWSYSVLLIAFFIAPRMWALAVNAFLIAGLIWRGVAFPGAYEATTFAVSGALVSLFAFVFAWRTEMQRRRLQDLASQDPLTGAGNRRQMELDLREAKGACESGRGCYGLALLDLDRFKQVNDLHGHEAGDAVLREFAMLVRRSVRKFDRFYRFGGEEFVLLLPVADEHALAAALDKVHRCMRERLRSPGGPVTVSIGAAMPRSGEDVTAWLARADAALYRAKRGGRDLLVVEGLEGPGEGIERRTIADDLLA